MEIEKMSLEELKQFANELMEENKKLKYEQEVHNSARQILNTMENDIYKGFDYSILENAYLEYTSPENTNINT